MNYRISYFGSRLLNNVKWRERVEVISGENVPTKLNIIAELGELLLKSATSFKNSGYNTSMSVHDLGLKLDELS